MRAQAITTSGFWRSYLITARPYLFFVSGAAGLVGLALRPTSSWASFGLCFAMLFASYGLGQALTDASQIDTDALSAPYRPLVQGLVTPGQIRGVSLTGFGLCAVGLVVLNPWALALCALGVAGLATYTWSKRRWWAGPLHNAGIVAMLPAIGFLCGGGGWGALWRSPPLWHGMASVLCSYAVFVVLGYLKDISADRATGYVTFPVRFGWCPSVALSAVLTVLALGASSQIVASAPRPSGPPSWGAYLPECLWLAGAAALVAAHLLLLATRDERRAHVGIGWSVRGFVLLHVGEAALLRPVLSVPLLVLCGLFELSLARRPERSQI